MVPICNGDLKRMFNKIDKNGDGVVSLEELIWLLERLGCGPTSPEELEALLAGKTSLDFTDFLFFYDMIINNDGGHGGGGGGGEIREEEVNDNNSGGLSSEKDLEKAFRVFDTNDDGFISSEELESALKKLGLIRDDDDCKRMISFYDSNLDGKLDFDEFKNMMSLSPSSS